MITGVVGGTGVFQRAGVIFEMFKWKLVEIEKKCFVNLIPLGGQCGVYSHDTVATTDSRNSGHKNYEEKVKISNSCFCFRQYNILNWNFQFV